MWEKSLSRNLILWELNRSLGCIICPRVGARILVFVCKSVLSPNFIGLVLQLTEWHKYSWNTQIHGLMGILCPQILGSQSYDYYILDAYESWIIIVLSCHRARQAMARRGLVHRARQGMKQQVQDTGLGKAWRETARHDTASACNRGALHNAFPNPAISTRRFMTSMCRARPFLSQLMSQALT